MATWIDKSEYDPDKRPNVLIKMVLPRNMAVAYRENRGDQGVFWRISGDCLEKDEDVLAWMELPDR